MNPLKACKTREELINNGQIVNNSNGTISVYTISPSTGKLAPYALTKPCCEILGQGAYFDTKTQKCRWSSQNSNGCDYTTPFNLVLNPKGNDGSIFYTLTDETCTLGIEFDYMFKFNCETLTNFINNKNTGNCNTLNSIFENLSASMTIDVVKTTQTSIVLDSIYKEQFFAPIGANNLEKYLISGGSSSGFYICAENAYTTGCTDLNLYNNQVNATSTCKPFIQQILTSLSGVPSDSFASNWINFSTEIANNTILSAITNQKIKLTIKLSGVCVDVCLMLDNIKLNRNCKKVVRNDIFLTKSPGFELDRIIDNKKSWIGNTETTHRTFNIANVDDSQPIRQTDYYLNDERQIINTKEIDLDIDIAAAVETDVWSYISDNNCLLTGNTIGTTLCVKDAISIGNQPVVFTSITSSTSVITGNCCPVTAITSSTVVYTSTTYTCPIGFSATPANDECQRITSIAPTYLGTGRIITAGDKSGLHYGIYGTYFYPEITSDSALPYNYSPNGNLVDANGKVIIANSINNSSSFWSSLSLSGNGRLNNAGIKAFVNSWAGFSQCVEIANGGTYYIGLAADNRCRFKINGVLVANFNTDIMVNFQKWSVFPIYLNSGLNIIEMEGWDSGDLTAFAAEIYNPTNFSTLYNATDLSESGANAIFTTGDKVGEYFNYGVGLGYSCPSNENYILNTCGVPSCTRLLKEPIIVTNNTNSVTTTGYCTDLSCVTYTITGQTIVSSGYTTNTTNSTVTACLPKTYCCSQYCGDANIDVQGLLTQPLSAITTIEDFEYYMTSELIDVKSRQTLSSYPTLRLLYDRYMNSLNFCKTNSSKFNYYSIDKFANLIGNYWTDLIEQVIPATTIWGSTKVYTNTIFDGQKFKYKNNTLLFGTPNFKNVLSPATGATCDVEINTTVLKGSDSVYKLYDEHTFTTAYAIQMNSGSEFIGLINVVGPSGTGGQVLNECALIIKASGTNKSYALNDGTATVSVMGSQGTPTYIWSNGEKTQTIIGLSAGTYSVIVTDNICSKTDSIKIQTI